MTKRRILFIDDDEAVLRLLKIVLERTCKYHVITQSKTSLVLQDVRQFKPEMIFIDINMPEKPGAELANEIRAESSFSKVPIIFLTGGISAEEVEQSDGEIGGQQFLSKPINKDHPSADDLYHDIRAQLLGISRTTIYRVLETFVKLGVVSKVSHPGVSVRFDPIPEGHNHLVCLRCEKISDAHHSNIKSLRIPKLSQNGFKIEDCAVYFRGVCADCQTSHKNKT